MPNFPWEVLKPDTARAIVRDLRLGRLLREEDDQRVLAVLEEVARNGLEAVESELQTRRAAAGGSDDDDYRQASDVETEDVARASAEADRTEGAHTAEPSLSVSRPRRSTAPVAPNRPRVIHPQADAPRPKKPAPAPAKDKGKGKARELSPSIPQPSYVILRERRKAAAAALRAAASAASAGVNASSTAGVDVGATASARTLRFEGVSVRTWQDVRDGSGRVPSPPPPSATPSVSVRQSTRPPSPGPSTLPSASQRTMPPPPEVVVPTRASIVRPRRHEEAADEDVEMGDARQDEEDVQNDEEDVVADMVMADSGSESMIQESVSARPAQRRREMFDGVVVPLPPSARRRVDVDGGFVVPHGFPRVSPKVTRTYGRQQ